ncbi:uncharacterized protein LAESUDRAFT_719881 [Laetiporus sulphureus 93-53]|uniref:Homeobox domain-containing protein n=1 Tax=Laetiporus sulphureus 93-53 TaxID=1314785 RepID=A0A165HMR6_9APHY|nr:uncharacterized protein LAESUDRAFT_719881 [Laetiporus sulphureus 93-53]KZT11939.1 hypothetical protein LAESUDRAFT_719881 [Laetiporus sulphureus 93-53]
MDKCDGSGGAYLQSLAVSHGGVELAVALRLVEEHWSQSLAAATGLDLELSRPALVGSNESGLWSESVARSGHEQPPQFLEVFTTNRGNSQFSECPALMGSRHESVCVEADVAPATDSPSECEEQPRTHLTEHDPLTAEPLFLPSFEATPEPDWLMDTENATDDEGVEEEQRRTPMMYSGIALAVQRPRDMHTNEDDAVMAFAKAAFPALAVRWRSFSPPTSTSDDSQLQSSEGVHSTSITGRSDSPQEQCPTTIELERERSACASEKWPSPPPEDHHWGSGGESTTIIFSSADDELGQLSEPDWESLVELPELVQTPRSFSIEVLEGLQSPEVAEDSVTVDSPCVPALLGLLDGALDQLSSPGSVAAPILTEDATISFVAGTVSDYSPEGIDQGLSNEHPQSISSPAMEVMEQSQFERHVDSPMHAGLRLSSQSSRDELSSLCPGVLEVVHGMDGIPTSPSWDDIPSPTSETIDHNTDAVRAKVTDDSEEVARMNDTSSPSAETVSYDTDAAYVEMPTVSQKETWVQGPSSLLLEPMDSDSGAMYAEMMGPVTSPEDGKSSHPAELVSAGSNVKLVKSSQESSPLDNMLVMYTTLLDMESTPEPTEAPKLPATVRDHVTSGTEDVPQAGSTPILEPADSNGSLSDSVSEHASGAEVGARPPRSFYAVVTPPLSPVSVHAELATETQDTLHSRSSFSQETVQLGEQALSNDLISANTMELPATPGLLERSRSPSLSLQSLPTASFENADVASVTDRSQPIYSSQNAVSEQPVFGPPLLLIGTPSTAGDAEIEPNQVRNCGTIEESHLQASSSPSDVVPNQKPKRKKPSSAKTRKEGPPSKRRRTVKAVISTDLREDTGNVGGTGGSRTYYREYLYEASSSQGPGLYYRPRQNQTLQVSASPISINAPVQNLTEVVIGLMTRSEGTTRNSVSCTKPPEVAQHNPSNNDHVCDGAQLRAESAQHLNAPTRVPTTTLALSHPHYPLRSDRSANESLQPTRAMPDSQNPLAWPSAYNAQSVLSMNPTTAQKQPSETVQRHGDPGQLDRWSALVEASVAVRDNSAGSSNSITENPSIPEDQSEHSLERQKLEKLIIETNTASGTATGIVFPFEALVLQWIFNDVTPLPPQSWRVLISVAFNWSIKKVSQWFYNRRGRRKKGAQMPLKIDHPDDVVNVTVEEVVVGMRRKALVGGPWTAMRFRRELYPRLEEQKRIYLIQCNGLLTESW